MLSGYAGDSLASALLASGPRVVSRSVNFGRPRGIYAAGSEEPNAYAQVVYAAASEPMLRTTRVQLFDGLEATGLNGKGKALPTADYARYDKVFAHCDVLVVGGGPAGLEAAATAGQTGARVMLVDEQPELGGSLLGAPTVGVLLDQLGAQPETRVLTRATAFGYYEANCIFVAQQLPAAQRLWQIRAKHVILATGAFERPLVFANNDRPGIMLAGAMRTYLHRYAVIAGRRVVLFTNNNSAYRVALDLVEAGVEVVALVDTRAEPAPLSEQLRTRGVQILSRHAVVSTEGSPELTAVLVQSLECGRSAGDDATADTLACDVLGGGPPAARPRSRCTICSASASVAGPRQVRCRAGVLRALRVRPGPGGRGGGGRRL